MDDLNHQSHTKTSVAFVIYGLLMGGAEKVISMLANQWALSGHEVTMITFERKTTQPHYRLAENVKLEHLDIADSTLPWRTKALAAIYRIRRTLNQTNPDIVISFINTTNMLVLLSNIPRTRPIIVSERVHPGLKDINVILRMLRRLLYKCADHLVVQSQDIAEQYSQILKPENITVIANPVEMPVDNGEQKLNKEPYTILAIGRLTPQKAFDVLIKAFAKVNQRYTEWNLQIYGSGAEKDNLEKLIVDLGLQACVKLNDPHSNVQVLMSAARIFALSSRYEGTPNALLEAMASGMPVIATDCPGGVSELIEHGKNGLLVNPGDIQALSKALETLISDPVQREKLGQCARQSVKQYSANNIYQKWRDLVSHVLTQK